MPNISRKESKPYAFINSRSRTTKRAKTSKRKKRSIQRLRQLTVSSQAVARVNSWNGLKNIPFLKLTGVWLEEVGFPIDCKVDVIVKKKRLIITPTEV